MKDHITDETALFLKAHQSNYIIQGFTQEATFLNWLHWVNNIRFRLFMIWAQDCCGKHPLKFLRMNRM